MRKIYRILVLLVLIIGFNINGSVGKIPGSNIKALNNDSCKCNYNCWPDLKDSINGLSVKQIFRFLKTIGIDCENNAEFSEYSNERLFKIMELNPDNFLKVIDAYNADLEFGEIIKQINSPINDGIDLKGIYKKIKKSQIASELKDRILKSIKYSIDLNATKALRHQVSQSIENWRYILSETFEVLRLSGKKNLLRCLFFNKLLKKKYDRNNSC